MRAAPRAGGCTVAPRGRIPAVRTRRPTRRARSLPRRRPPQHGRRPGRSGRQLRAEICDAQERGAWDDDGWAYRKRVEEWTERTANVLAGCGRDDLARALAEVEVPPRPPFESLLKGYSPSYARLVGLLDGRLGLLEQSQS